MGDRFRLVLRSTETRPSQETQDSVMPALSQKFGSRADLHATDLDPDDQRGDAIVGTATVDTAAALRDVYAYVKPHNLVKVGDVEATEDGTVFRRKDHEVDDGQLATREDLSVLGRVRGDVLVHVEPPEGSA
jgi:uncharacterized protein involved in tellurium resistance